MEKTNNRRGEHLHDMVLNREMAARADAIDTQTRSAELTFSSEEPYTRWFGNEILCHDEGCMDLSRLQEIGVLLWNHNDNKPIGRIESAWVDEDKRGHAKVIFDTDEESDRIFQKVQTGTLRGVSVGYRVSVWEDVENGAMSTNGRFAGPCSIAMRWEPYEISIVSVPADATVGVGRSLQEGEQTMGEQNNKPKKEQTYTPEIDPAKRKEEAMTQEEMQAEMKRAIEEERKRTSEIMALCRKFGMEADEFIKKGMDIAAVQKEVLQKMAEQNKPTGVVVEQEEREKFRAAAIDGLAMRAGIAVEKPADGAYAFRGRSLLRLAQEIYERETGLSAARLQDEELLRSVMSGGTGNFPNILANVGNKSMMHAYTEIPTTYQYWTARGSNSDFKPSTRVGLGAADELLEMTENGEFKSAEVTDYGQTTGIKTFGRSYSITRKAIINDDLGALTELPAKYGAAVRRMINRMAYDALTKDTTLFDSKNKNSGKGTISITSLAAGKVAMARQTDPSGKAVINVLPVYLIVPPELETTASQLIASAVDPTKNNAVPNPFANKLTVVSDPCITDTEAWYLAAAPGVIPGIEITYLNGKDTPTMETQVDFNTLGIKHRIYMDVGVNILDFRAFYKSTGKDA